MSKSGRGNRTHSLRADLPYTSMPLQHTVEGAVIWKGQPVPVVRTFQQGHRTCFVLRLASGRTITATDEQVLREYRKAGLS